MLKKTKRSLCNRFRIKRTADKYWKVFPFPILQFIYLLCHFSSDLDGYNFLKFCMEGTANYKDDL